MTRAAAYHRLAIIILGLDVATLANEIAGARRQRSSARANHSQMGARVVFEAPLPVLRNSASCADTDPIANAVPR
jgi:hypothetical protein